MHSKNHVVKLTTAKTYSVRFQKSIESKILIILTFNSLSRVQIAVNARMRFGVILPKISPNGRESEWLSVRVSVGANHYFSHKINEKRKIDAECSKINCNCHIKIKYEYLH
jgi:hypothetical protein